MSYLILLRIPRIRKKMQKISPKFLKKSRMNFYYSRESMHKKCKYSSKMYKNARDLHNFA